MPEVGPQLVLDAVMLFQLAAHTEFFSALPPGMDDLGSVAHAAREKALAIALGRSDCDGCTDTAGAMAPFRDALGGRLAAVYAADPGALDPLTSYLTACRGYRPRPIRLHYRDEVGSRRTLTW